MLSGTFDLPSLAATVHDYTRDALNALSAQGTPAQMLQLGNEIRNGILWPTGQLDGSVEGEETQIAGVKHATTIVLE